MNLNINTTTNINDPANFIALSVLSKLSEGKSVLLFLTGGSSVNVGIKISEILNKYPDQNIIKDLTILLTDERYGEIGHSDSNYFKLIKGGFILEKAKVIETLIGKDYENTVKIFNNILTEEFKNKEYKIGLFGIGADGHTAGILPNSVATLSKDLACGYETPSFSRITMTFNAIEKLDEAVVWMQGSDKWEVLKDLEGEIDPVKQPAQILKRVPLLTFFTDFKK